MIKKDRLVVKAKRIQLTKTFDDICINCDTKKAEVYEVNGDYCLECWQRLTHPEV
jgi:hypothetical protein